MYRVTCHCYAINFDEIPPCFVVNVYLWLLCIIKWSKLGRYQYLWSFLVKFGVSTELSIYRITPVNCFVINFEEITSYFALNVFLWLLWFIKWSKLVRYLHNTIFGVIFGDFWLFVYLNRWGDHIWVPPLFCT